MMFGVPTAVRSRNNKLFLSVMLWCFVFRPVSGMGALGKIGITKYLENIL